MIITSKDFATIRQNHKGQKIVFCSGTFDILHPGHISFLQAAKTQGDVLIVSIGNDVTVLNYKGQNRPKFNEKARIYHVDSLKMVDYCYLDSPDPDKHPVLIDEVVFESLKPDIWVVNSDAFNNKYRKQLAKKHDIEFFVLNRDDSIFPQFSTSKIVDKIRADKRFV